MKSHIPGFPRIGAGRELKKALESFWKGEISERKLHETASEIKAENWRIQKESGLTHVAVNDFSLYDHVLDTALMFGFIPERFKRITDPLDLYFAMARGSATKDIRPLSMKKWFNTNYHYLVPEISSLSAVSLNPAKPVLEAKEAFRSGFNPKPVILGPITFLSLCEADGCSPWDFTEDLTAAYIKLIESLSPYCEWIEIDEPLLASDMSKDAWLNFIPVHRKIKDSTDVRLMIASTCGDAGDNTELAFETGYDAFHTDLTKTDTFTHITNHIPDHMLISAGIVDGRNIWKTDCRKAYTNLEQIASVIGREKIIVSSGSSLLHVPVDLTYETDLQVDVKNKMAFAVQKCSEIAELTKAFEKECVSQLPEADYHHPKNAPVIYDESFLSRNSSRKKRKEIQTRTLNLPVMPTTTIGSFPQTKEIREQRTRFRNGKLSSDSYEAFIRKQIESVIRLQEELGLDILVHGEPERNDMVEYFAEYLDGFAFTKNGCRIIQIDEAAFREGLPLKKADQEDYLKTAVKCFRIVSSGISDMTQLHTHMCYSEFNSIMEHIDAMDADVISIEASRGGMKLLEVFKKYQYQGDIGPGVYDIHSPRVPSSEEIHKLIRQALEYISPVQLWINPDCGLKTRNNEEAVPSLKNMAKAASVIRAETTKDSVAG